MATASRQNWIGSATALIGVAFVTLLYRLIITGVNDTTIALTYLLVVLAVASKYRLGPSITASLAGMICFNFFFLPPVGTFTVHDPQNWVALLAFLITAVTASQLSSAASERTREADKRREEVTELYRLSRAIIATPDSETALSSIARQVIEVFAFQYCAVFIPASGGNSRRLAAAGALTFTPSEALINKAFASGDPIVSRESGSDKTPAENGRISTSYIPLKVGVRSTGVLVVAGPPPAGGAAEAIAGLVALALERARFLQEVSRTEALRQSDELKAAILASVSHDLRTPLTAIRTAVDSLLQEDIEWDRSAVREFHLIISEEVERLTRLVRNLLEMARIEAGELQIAKRWESVSEIVYDVLDRCSTSIRNHQIDVQIDRQTPPVKVDSRLIGQALSLLISNAAMYSPSGSEISVRAAFEDGELKLSVSDQGPGITPDEQDRVFEKFYRGARVSETHREGTGMGLAVTRGIVEALGGKIWIESAPGGGATFTFSIPAECMKTEKPAESGEAV
jgi:two-component system sensor histidine kinase KdpD